MSTTKQLVEEKTFAGDTSVTFSGLNSTVDSWYTLECEFKTAANASVIYLYVNNDTTATNYYTSYHFFGTDAAEHAVGHTHTSNFSNVGNASNSITIAQIFCINGIFSYTSTRLADLAEGSVASAQFVCAKTTGTITSITSLTLTASVASQLVAGGKARLYRHA